MEVINQRKTGGRHHIILVSENWAADRSGAVATLHAVDHWVWSFFPHRDVKLQEGTSILAHKSQC